MVLVSAIAEGVRSQMRKVNPLLPGIVQSYDSSIFRVLVKPIFKVYDVETSTYINPPSRELVLSLPFCSQSAFSFVRLQSGDLVWIHVGSMDYSAFFQKKGDNHELYVQPIHGSHFDLSNAYCVPGLMTDHRLSQVDWSDYLSPPGEEERDFVLGSSFGNELSFSSSDTLVSSSVEDGECKGVLRLQGGKVEIGNGESELLGLVSTLTQQMGVLVDLLSGDVDTAGVSSTGTLSKIVAQLSQVKGQLDEVQTGVDSIKNG